MTLRVTNTGDYPGRDVVQLYASAPESELYKPVRELKAFATTPVLAPGSSATLELTFSAYDLASFDESLSAFVSQEGTYTLQLNRDASTIVTTLPLTLKKTLRWPVTRAE